MKIYMDYLHRVSDNKAELEKARDRMEAIDTVDMTLGDGCRAQFTAASGFASYAEALNSVTVVRALKREAILQCGSLTLFANRYGVVSFHLPTGINVASLNWSQHSILDGHSLLARLGAEVKSTGRMLEYIHDYSALKPSAKTA